MKVSILTPYYNGRKFLEESVESVLAQTYDDYELLITNDASPDNPVAFLNDLASRDNRIKILSHDENKGIAAARNSALKIATGTYIALLDQDDCWLPDKLQLQVDCFENNPDAGLVFTNYFRTDEQGNVTGQGSKCKAVVSDTIDGTLTNLFMKNRITACTVMFRKEAIDSLGAFNEQLKGGTDDYDMWLRIAGQYGLIYVDQPLVKRRTHGDNTSTKFKERGMLDHIVIVDDICNRYPLLNSFRAKRLSKIYCHLGRYYSRGGKNGEALSCFRKALKERPFSVRIYLELLKCWIK